MNSNLGSSDRFPFSAFPSGWFCVGLSEDVAIGEVVSLFYFGRKLVAFRGESGELHVADAHCPHLGADLGSGGRVEGDGIRCPFHAWRFEGSDGRCSDVPYAKRIPARARLTMWPVFEYCGLVLVYHAEHTGEGQRPAPSWTPDLPSCRPEDWRVYGRRKWTVRTHIQEIGENGLDVAHVPVVHGSDILEVLELVEEGPVMRLDSRPQNADKAKFDGLIRRTLWGLGLSLNEFIGAVESRVFLTRTPIDTEQVEVRMTFLPKCYENEKLTEALGKASMERVSAEFEGDIEIWEHKAYIENPVLCDGDGPLGRWRGWASQFYCESISVHK